MIQCRMAIVVRTQMYDKIDYTLLFRLKQQQKSASTINRWKEEKRQTHTQYSLGKYFLRHVKIVWNENKTNV